MDFLGTIIIAARCMDTQTLMNILTAGLAVATVWLAIETRRMASAAKAQVDLQSQPFLSFRGVDIISVNAANLSNGHSQPAFGLRLRLGNPGQVLVSYNVEDIHSSLTDQALTPSSFKTTGGVIHPSEETLFILPFAINAASTLLPLIDIEFTISYWAVPTKYYWIKAKVQVQVISLNPLNWQWVFISGPTYT